MARIAGTAFVSVNGEQIRIGGTVTYAPFDIERESVVGLGGRVGSKEMKVAPYIEIECIVTSETDLAKIQNETDFPVTVELANGNVYVLRNAELVGRMEVDGTEGKTSLRFEGDKMELTTSAPSAEG